MNPSSETTVNLPERSLLGERGKYTQKKELLGKASDDLIIRVHYESRCVQPFSHIITFNDHNHPLTRSCLALQMKTLSLREMA